MRSREKLRAGNCFRICCHALELFARNQRLFQLLQVDGRAVVVVEVAQLVAGQHVDQQIPLLQARSHSSSRRVRAASCFRQLAGPRRVEQALGVFRLVQVVAQDAVLVFLGQEIGLGLGGLDDAAASRSSLASQLLHATLPTSANSARNCGRSGADPHARQHAAAPLQPPRQRVRAAPRAPASSFARRQCRTYQRLMRQRASFSLVRPPPAREWFAQEIEQQGDRRSRSGPRRVQVIAQQNILFQEQQSSRPLSTKAMRLVSMS